MKIMFKKIRASVSVHIAQCSVLHSTQCVVHCEMHIAVCSGGQCTVAMSRAVHMDSAQCSAVYSWEGSGTRPPATATIPGIAQRYKDVLLYTLFTHPFLPLFPQI